MKKEDFVIDLKNYKQEISNIASICASEKGIQVQRKTTLSQVESIATKWFDSYSPILRIDFEFEENILQIYEERFGKLLELSDGRPSKRILNNIIDGIIKNFRSDIIIPVQKYNTFYKDYPIFQKLLKNTNESEKNYLFEAIDCARTDKIRAAIVLGWCCAINRLQQYVEKESFEKFNHSSLQMTNINTGRYKRFNKKFEIQNLTDLRMTVLDQDLLWILEFWGAIDGNQHERLSICFTMRNTSAHPGEAPFSMENLLSFFSDLDAIIFSNPKFIF